MKQTKASEYLNETILYGGLPFKRGDVERELDRLGVTGPARLAWSRKEEVNMYPLPGHLLENVSVIRQEGRNPTVAELEDTGRET